LNENAQKDYHHSTKTPSTSISQGDDNIVAEGKQDDASLQNSNGEYLRVTGFFSRRLDA
jgi:hypothetical protein